MKKFIYIKFQNPFYKSNEKSNLNSFKNNFLKILKLLIPQANPDFEGKYDSVKIWYLELSTEGNYANREIGINDKGLIVLISPYKKNLGYWIDSNFTLEDYQRFSPETIAYQEFENHWINFKE